MQLDFYEHMFNLYHKSPLCGLIPNTNVLDIIRQEVKHYNVYSFAGLHKIYQCLEEI